MCRPNPRSSPRSANARRAGTVVVLDRLCRGLLALPLLLLAVGCGGGSPNVPCQGRVLVDGGIPLGEGRLILIADPPSDKRKPCGASINPDGEFTCYAYEGGPGIPPGTYKVVLAFASGKGVQNPYAKAFAEYTTVDATPLRLQVPPGGRTDVVLELKAPAIEDQPAADPQEKAP